MDAVEGWALLQLATLAAAGLLGGFVNTLAGGGSLVTLPALLLLGLPADVANGTNRVGVLAQSLVAARGLGRDERLRASDGLWVLAPCLAGSLAGAFLAALLLSLTTVAGAELGVRFALARGQDAIRKVVLVAVIASCLAVALR
jgi:uncharacterized membrane protein YfcA